MTKKLSAVILGTRSGPRLKTPVPLLPFGSGTVLSRTVEAYLAAGFQEVVLVLGSRGVDLRPSLGATVDRVRIVETPLPDARFAEMLRTGVEAAGSSEGIALGYGDQPLLTAEVITDLAGRFAASDGKILVPSWQGHLGHPVFIRAALFSALKTLPVDAGFWEVLKSHSDDVRDVEIAHTAVVRGIEDRADYHDLLRLAGLPVPEPSLAEIAAEGAVGGNGGYPGGMGSGVASFGGDDDD